MDLLQDKARGKSSGSLFRKFYWDIPEDIPDDIPDIPEAIVESAGAALVSVVAGAIAFVSAPEVMVAFVSVDVVVVVVEVEGGFDASEVESELLLQPTSVNGKAIVTATMGEYFWRKLFMGVFKP